MKDTVSYQAFEDLFPEIGRDERRHLKIIEENEYALPIGTYRFIEMFCREPGCDCRRVMFYITSTRPREVEAVIGYGWEGREFYAKLNGSDDPSDIAQLQGPVLNIPHTWSELAPALLAIFIDLILPDRAYIERVKEHYRMFRARSNEGLRKAPARKRRIKCTQICAGL